jgi:hypothetical protein
MTLLSSAQLVIQYLNIKKIANTKDVWDEHGINVNRPSIQEICQAK